MLLEACLKDSHGCQTTTTHGDVGELIGGTVSVDGEEVRSSRVNSAEDEVGTDLSLVSENQLKAKTNAE